MQKNTNTEIEKIIRKYRVLIPIYLIVLYFIMFFLEFYIYGNVVDGMFTPAIGTLGLVIMLGGFLIGVLNEVAKALQDRVNNSDSDSDTKL